MDKEKAITILRKHQAWRRYNGPIGDGPKMQEPKEIGEAIDVAIESLQDKQDIAEIVQQYIDKGDRCMDQSATDDDQGGYTFWDGFHNCAVNIMQELKKHRNDTNP